MAEEQQALPPIVIGDIVPPVALTLRQALVVCQFTEAEVNLLIAQAIPNWSVFLRMKEKDITTMAEDYGKRTALNGRIVFGFFCTKELQGLMHWTQDMKRMSKFLRSNS
jgi:hypothetical protein